MRGVLHLAATIVLLPYIALAGWFLILGEVIASGSLWAIFDTLVERVAWLIPWGLLGIVAGIVLVAALGFIMTLRWLGGLCLFMLAACCLLIVLTRSASTIGVGEALFLLPCVAVLVVGGWTTLAGWRPWRPVADSDGGVQ